MIYQLQDLAVALEALNDKTEGEFLSIGSNLNDIYSRSGEISNIASSTADLILGKEITKAIDDFRQLQERVNVYLGRVDTEMAQCKEKLRQILAMINSTNRPLSELKEISKLLQMLAISTRIVTVRLGKHNAGFDSLADNIKAMSKLIHSKSSHILVQSRSLGNLINNAISAVQELEDRQGGLATEILSNTMLGLGAITNMKKGSSGAAGIANVISDMSNDASGKLSDIMVSLQFHDITHQKIARSIEEIKAASAALRPGGETDSTLPLPKGGKSRFGNFNTYKLLGAELGAERDALVCAVKGIIVNLRGIAKNVVELSSEIEKTAGSVSNDYSSFWHEMDQVMASFTCSIREDADTSGKLSEVMHSVAETVSNMSEFVGDIEGIGSDIRLIAYNARIKAAHLGKKGASAGLIAEKIQKLSLDAGEKTGSILETLNRISMFAKELSSYEDSGAKIEEVGLDDVVSRLVDILNPIHMVDDKIISHLNMMDKDSNRLVEDINRLIAGITVHNEVEILIGDVISALEGMEEILPTVETEGELEKVEEWEEISLVGKMKGDDGRWEENFELF